MGHGERPGGQVQLIGPLALDARVLRVHRPLDPGQFAPRAVPHPQHLRGAGSGGARDALERN